MSEENARTSSAPRRRKRRKQARRNQMILVAAAAALLILIAIVSGIVAAVKHSHAKKAELAEEEILAETETAQIEPLEENTDPAINELMERYYKALADGDIDAVLKDRDYVGEAERLQILNKSNYLDRYSDLVCYRKPGPAAGTDIVYVSYNAWFQGLEQGVPGLNTYVVCTDADGRRYIHDCTNDEELKEFRTQTNRQDDVVELFNRIQLEYNDLVAGDEQVSVFLNDLAEGLKNQVSEQLAQAVEKEEAEAQQEIVEAEEISEEPEVIKVRTTDSVRIRKTDSTEAEILDTVGKGLELTLIEKLPNGWSKVSYKGKDAFVNSDYLEVVGQNKEAAADSDTAKEGSDSEKTTADVPDRGSYKISDALNMRAQANENAERVAVLHAGDTITIVQKQSDGWTKVQFEGKTGYIKTDVLK